MALSSASTDAEVEAAFDDNANYDDGAGDVGKARLYQQACRMLIRRYPSAVGSRGTNIQRNLQILENELKRVVGWLDANDSDRTAAEVTFIDLREARR